MIAEIKRKNPVDGWLRDEYRSDDRFDACTIAKAYHGAGAVCGSEDADIHQISNLQPDGQELITLHVYTPPLGRVGNYSLTDNTVTQVLSKIHTVERKIHDAPV